MEKMQDDSMERTYSSCSNIKDQLCNAKEKYEEGERLGQALRQNTLEEI